MIHPMNTDDVPSLGGQPDDDSPMIGGPPGSIDAARKEYQTGKAEALFRGMTPDQQTRFRQVFLRPAVMHVEQMLAGDPRYQAARDLLQTMQQWIDNLPTMTADQTRTLLTVYDAMENRPVVGPKKTMDHLLQAFTMGIFPASKHAAHAIAKSVLYLAYENPDQAPFRAEADLAMQVMRWHLKVAWAILNDASVSPLELEP
jgi:hypothetical protein